MGGTQPGPIITMRGGLAGMPPAWGWPVWGEGGLVGGNQPGQLSKCGVDCLDASSLGVACWDNTVKQRETKKTKENKGKHRKAMTPGHPARDTQSRPIKRLEEIRLIHSLVPSSSQSKGRLQVYRGRGRQGG